MANLSEDIQCAGSDTRPPMLDKADFLGPREESDEGTKGPINLGPERPRVYSELSQEEKDRIWTCEDALEGSATINGKDVNHNYHSQSSNESTQTYHHHISVDTSQLIWACLQLKILIENLTPLLPIHTWPYVTQSFTKPSFPQTNNQLRNLINPRNQATVTDGRVIVQNDRVEETEGQGNSARASSVKLVMGEHRTSREWLIRVKAYGRISATTATAGGLDNAIDEDVDEQPVQDLALNVDNVFQADDCRCYDLMLMITIKMLVRIIMRKHGWDYSDDVRPKPRG
ncbi:hypothetical protein Tco_0503171 [Tanacetum coccineum]